MKKSGLADSPFFAPPPSQEEIQVPPPVMVEQPLFKRTDAQTHERTTERMHENTNEQTHERTNTQPHNRADAQTHERTDAPPSRPISRYSYDIFDDQADAIEALRLQWHKKRGRHITKGQVMRELLEQALKTHE